MNRFSWKNLNFESELIQFLSFESIHNQNLAMLQWQCCWKRKMGSIWRRYNTMLPSSAPVERLFSMAALVLTGKRANLSDTLLEHLILLKINRNLWNTYWIIFELFLNYFQFIFEFWINSNWINSLEKIELKIESESWINSMLIELCKHWRNMKLSSLRSLTCL